MKFIVALCSALFLTSFSAFAQPEDGSVAADFTEVDIYGNSHTLSSYTGEGKNVILVFFTAWCAPNWNYHNTGSVQDFYALHGPDGDNSAMVFFIEVELGNSIDQIYGIEGAGNAEETQGDWTLNSPYPIIDDEDGSIMYDYTITYFPTVVVVCGDGVIQDGDAGQQNTVGLENVTQSCYAAIGQNNPKITSVNTPNSIGCEQEDGIDLEIMLTNFGLDPLTACDILISGAVEETTYNWTGDLDTYESETINLYGLPITGTGSVYIEITSPDDDPDGPIDLYLNLPVTGTSHFHFHFMTDAYPEETYWELIKDGTVVLESTPYEEDNSWYEHDFYVSETGCYEFILYDTWGDGINGPEWTEQGGFIKLFTIDEIGNMVEYAINYNDFQTFEEMTAAVDVVEIVPVTISGIVFEDADEDGYYDDNENGIGNVEVHLDNMVTYTNENGAYSFTDAEGTQDLSIIYNETAWPTATTETELDISSASDATFDFGLSANDPSYNVSFDYSEPWMYFCQFESVIYFSVTNEGNQPLDEIIATLTIDPLLTIISADPNAAISGNTITWTLEDIGTGETDFLSAVVMVPSFEFMGSDIINTVSVEAFDDGVSVDTDASDFPDILECSYDPNDKQVIPAGVTDQHYIMNGTDLEYLIRFQNTGTAPAFNINVQDMLDSDLQYSTFEVLATSHQCQPTINLETGEVNFYFADIMLPDSTSDEPGSHGFIRYRISPLPGLPEMTTIENTANIYFDFNPAVVTNTTLNTISDLYFGIEEYDRSLIMVFPNPANDQVTIHNPGTSTLNELVITDAVGKIVRSENTFLFPGEKMTINISALSAGIYMIRMNSISHTFSGSLVIQR